MLEKLKIAMISVHSCPVGKLGGRDTGGMNVYIVELARQLGRRGHLVDIYTRVHQPRHEQIVSLGQNVRLIHLKTGSNEEIPKIDIYSYLQNFTCEVENFRKFENSHYDLIHSHYWLSGLVGKQLQTSWHLPHVVMFHTLGAIKNSIGIGKDEPELRIAGEQEVVDNCQCIIAATETEKRDLIQHYSASPQKIDIVPCGVNLNLFKPINKEIARKELNLDGDKVILFIGRIEPLKGIDQMLRALTYITDKETLRVMIVGGDEHSQDMVHTLQKMARELHIEEHVSFIGAAAQERLPLFYSAADICVIPSYYESFGMVALESLACGTPLVATDVGDMRHIIRSNEAGRIASDNSPRQLASKISELLSQTKNQEQHIKTRRAMTAEFSWVHITDMILREYDRVCKNY